MDTLTIHTYFVEYPEILWLAIGFGLIALELSIAPGIGILFAGIAGVSLGGLLAFGVLNEPDFYLQLVWFFGLTVGWAVVLWRPLKKYLRSSTGVFDMYVGTTAIVQEGGVSKDKTGTVRWSGSNMRARVRKDAKIDKIEEGEEVYIHAMKNGVMHVDIAPHESNN